MNHLKRGLLIAIEGIDGSGKTLLTTNLAALLAQSYPVLTTREPGGSLLGKNLRGILHEKKFAIDSKAEYLLFAADRAQHFQEVIIPALAANNLVLSDRLGDSSLVYQGYGRGLDKTMIQTINTWAMNGLSPDLVIYVRVDATIAYERLVRRGKPLTSFEQEPRSFFEKLCTGFDDIYRDQKNVLPIDGTQSPTYVAHNTYEKLTAWLSNNTIL
jgi:dTMP kinase